MRFFLDTEWQNNATRDLVSLALVSADGAHRFYAERDPLPDAPSAFVREVVYPLLERGKTALPDREFGRQLRSFLAPFDSPLVMADALLDFTLLNEALRGFEQGWPSQAAPYRPIHVTYGDVLNNIEVYFESNPIARARRHHAAVDAEALRWAFETSIELS